ncbi:hypothetical protein RBB72_28340, partial [Pseudomonas aeruginosa]
RQRQLCIRDRWGAALILGAAACGWLSAQRPAAGTADCRERLD